LVRGAAAIDLVLPSAGGVRVAVHDIAGRVVRIILDQRLEAGAHALAWDGIDASGNRVASGVYLVRASTASGMKEAKTMIVLH
jgi:flagellar hook assembly protein FlgD